jgi:histidine ammonia-lyase
VADITAAMSVEGLLGTDDVFADDLHALRPHRHGIYARSLQAARSGRATIPRPVPESRTPTRCAVRRRWPAPYATPLIMLSGSP